MDPSPGLSDLSATGARSRRRRRRLDPNPQLQHADRLLTTSTGSHENLSSTSNRSKKRSAPMSFDPNVATRSWEVYKDPSEESLHANLNQPRNSRPATELETRLATTTPASHQAAMNELQQPQGHLAETGSYPSSRSSTPPRYTINSVPNEAARIVAERMLRTLNIVFSEERGRQRRATAAVAAANRDGDIETIPGPATDAEMVRRLQMKYAELTLLDEEHEERISQVALQAQDALAGEGPAQDQVQLLSEQRNEARESEPEPMDSEQAISTPDTNTPLRFATIQPSSSTQTSGFISMSGGTTGSGLSFAERAKAGARTIAQDQDQERQNAVLAESGDEGDGDYTGIDSGRIANIDATNTMDVTVARTGIEVADDVSMHALSNTDHDLELEEEHHEPSDKKKTPKREHNAGHNRERERRGKRPAHLVVSTEHEHGYEHGQHFQHLYEPEAEYEQGDDDAIEAEMDFEASS